VKGCWREFAFVDVPKKEKEKHVRTHRGDNSVKAPARRGADAAFYGALGANRRAYYPATEALQGARSRALFPSLLFENTCPGAPSEFPLCSENSLSFPNKLPSFFVKLLVFSVKLLAFVFQNSPLFWRFFNFEYLCPRELIPNQL
jgi:hypothetical protein